MTDTSAREIGIVGTLLEMDGDELPPTIGKLLTNAPDSFDCPRCGKTAFVIRRQRDAGQHPTPHSIIEELDFEGAALFVSNLQGYDITLAEADAEPVWEAYRRRKVKSVLGDGLNAMEADPSKADAIAAGVRKSLEDLDRESERSDATKLLAEREFKPGIVPPPLRPIYTLTFQPVATPGNIATITSAIKTGKTAVVGALASSASPHSHDADLLGFKSENPQGYGLLDFDSEQSPDDHWYRVDRILRRAGLSELPAWLHSYCFTGLGYKRAWACVVEAAKVKADKYGGLHSILLDGVADYVRDVNDAGESNDKVAELHDMAIQYDCPIWCVIHFNPGGDKSRGHLGSQLERKAETNLRLDKENGITTIWSDKQRRGPIPKDCGPCFQWSDEFGMHVSVPNRKAAADDEKREALTMLADELFSKKPAFHYSDLIGFFTAKKGLAVSERTAARKVNDMSRLGIIQKDVIGLWIRGKT